MSFTNAKGQCGDCGYHGESKLRLSGKVYLFMPLIMILLLILSVLSFAAPIFVLIPIAIIVFIYSMRVHTCPDCGSEKFVEDKKIDVQVELDQTKNAPSIEQNLGVQNIDDSELAENEGGKIKEHESPKNSSHFLEITIFIFIIAWKIGLIDESSFNTEGGFLLGTLVGLSAGASFIWKSLGFMPGVLTIGAIALYLIKMKYGIWLWER